MSQISCSRTQTACRLPGGGRFWVEDGERVVVEAGHGDRPVPWLHATVARSCSPSRDASPCMPTSSRSMAWRWPSPDSRRAGKSTTSLALAQRGHRLVTDDVATLDIEGDIVVHRPAGRPVHIHPATAERLGVSLEGGIPVLGDPGKLALSNPASPPVPVRGIVLLRAVDPEAADVKLVRLSTAQGTQAVHRQAYRRGMLAPVWRAELFEWAARWQSAFRCGCWFARRTAGAWTRSASRSKTSRAIDMPDKRRPPSRRPFRAVVGARFLRRAAIGLEAGVALTWASVAVRRASGPEVTRLLGEPSAPMQGMAARPQFEAWRVGRAVSRVAGWLPWRPTCLPQAVATRLMLRRRGIDFESHLGVIQTAPFEAHAWVTVRGTPVVGGPTHHATRIATFR